MQYSRRMNSGRTNRCRYQNNAVREECIFFRERCREREREQKDLTRHRNRKEERGRGEGGEGILALSVCPQARYLSGGEGP